MVPLFCPHTCHRGIVIDSRIVHEHLNWAVFQNLCQGLFGGKNVADIEAGDTGRSAVFDNLFGYFLS